MSQAVGVTKMRELQELVRRIQSAAATAIAEAPNSATELDKHQIRRQAAEAVESLGRVNYWISQAYGIDRKSLIP